MKYIEEFRNHKLSLGLQNRINVLAKGKEEIVLMEVCGTHTMAIFRYGIRQILPKNIKLISGPGCPVCVTPNEVIDKAIVYARYKDIILATFGDMIRVPGSSSSLEKERASGGDIKVVYSTLDALQIAKNNPLKKVVFLAIGFETTSPTIASCILEARKKNIKNFYVLTANKVIPPAMEVLVNTEELRVDGFICPGHVSTIIGSRPYEPIANKYKVPCVISGFEPIDILQSTYMLVNQIINKEAKVEVQYQRVVKEEGNKIALGIIEEVFKVEDSNWRGVGIIPNSGHTLKDKYQEFNILENLSVEVEETKETPGCICGLILQGLKTPLDCNLFREICKPENPVGACMVSSEGTCAAYYKYGSF